MAEEQIDVFFAGRYRKGKPLGDSALYNAKVYEAYDIDEDDSPVAVKILHLDDQSSTKKAIAWAMFKKEIGALEGVEHDSIVKMFDSFYDRNEAGIVLELIEDGVTLEDLISQAQSDPRSRKPLQWKVAQLIKILDALGYTHQRQIVHRDIKLRNILYDRISNTLKLVDFGVSKLIGQFSTDVRTLPGHMSWPYCSPEQRDRQEARKQADLYAFGIVIAAFLTDQIPQQSFLRVNLRDFLEPLRSHIEKVEVYDVLFETLYQVMDPDPEARPDRWEIQRALDTLQGSLTNRPEAIVCISTRDRKRIEEEFGVAKFLLDLNDGIRASSDRIEGQQTFTYRLFGKSVWIEAKQDEEDGERIIINRHGRIKHVAQAESRDKAVSIPHRIKFAPTGNAFGLINFLYDQYLIDIEVATNKERREDYLKLADEYLTLREERLKDLWLGCVWVKGFRPGNGAIRSNTDGYTLVPGDQITLIAVAASREEPVDGQLAIDDEMTARLTEFAETFERSTNLIYKDRTIGRISKIIIEERKLEVEIMYETNLKIEQMSLTNDDQQNTIFIAKNDGLERSLRRERDAVEAFILGHTDNLRLPKLLLKPKLNQIHNKKSRPLLRNDLKPADKVQDLVERALAAKDIYAIQGPPGTGKTTTITEIVSQILKETPNSRILLTSQNNDAVDNAMQKIALVAQESKTPIRMLREVSDLRNRPNPLAFTETFSTWVSATASKSGEIAESAILTKSPLTGEQESSIRSTLNNWSGQLRVAEDVKEDFLLNIQVFGVTCLRLPALFKRYPHLQDLSFDWIIVDEAARAHASELLVALNRGQRIILVGDQKQLPPHLDRDDALELEAKGHSKEDIKTSLFEKLFISLLASNKSRLGLQFRMHESIARLISNLYYSDDGEALVTDVSDSDMSLPIQYFERPDRAFWVDVRGRQESVDDSNSQMNRLESQRIGEILNQLETHGRHARPSYTPQRLTVAVITPYELQKQHLNREIVPDAKARWRMLDIVIDTVDAFQGKQADIVILSLVSTEGRKNKFIGDPHRLNVAFSRAQRLLLIIGDIERARRDEELKRVVEAIPSTNHLKWGKE